MMFSGLTLLYLLKCTYQYIIPKVKQPLFLISKYSVWICFWVNHNT